MKILFYVTALYKDFFIDYAKFLSERGHSIEIIAHSNDVNVYIKRKTNFLFKVHTLDNNLKIYSKNENTKNDISNNHIYLDYEKKYQFHLSHIISKERYIDRGHIHSIEYRKYHPRQDWNRNKKFNFIIEKIKMYENILEISNPNLVFCFQRYHFLEAVCNIKKIKLLNFAPAKLNERYFICDKSRNNSSLVIKSIIKNSKIKDIRKLTYHFEQIWYGKRNNKIQHSLIITIKKIVNTLFTKTKQHIIQLVFKTNIKRVSVFVWIKHIIIEYLNYLSYKKLSKKLVHLNNLKFVYFPLHLEPEKVLQDFASEFNNSLEIISWVSKCLPADHYLVIKEHNLAFGSRSTDFYKKISSLCNVILIRSDENSLEIIKKSSIIIGINGTVINEAIFFEKPVLTYVNEMYFNYISTVKYSSNYHDTKKNLSNFILNPPSYETLNKNKNIFLMSILDNSFKFDNIEYLKHGESSVSKDFLKNITSYINKFFEYEEKI